MKDCYCGGRLKIVYQNIAQCQTCKRYWIETDLGWCLAVPWVQFVNKSEVKEVRSDSRSKFKVEVHWWCQRCGAECKLHPQTFRVECKNCQYSWSAAQTEGRPPIIHRLAERRKILIAKLSEVDANSKEEAEIVDELKAIKSEIENLVQVTL